MASVRKRSWVYNGETKEAWVCEYTDASGKRRRKTFERKKDADKFRNDVAREVENGAHIPDSEALTLVGLCERYLRFLEDRRGCGEIGESTLRRARTVVDNHIRPFFGKKKVTELSWTDVESWAGDMRGKGLSAASIRIYADVLKSIEAYGEKRGIVKTIVVAKARRELGSSSRRPIKTFDSTQVASLLAESENRPYRHEERACALACCAVHLGGFCGLRLGEILGLTVRNIDFTRRVIKVRHSLTRWDELKGPKTRAGIRDVPMPNGLAEKLKVWVDRHYIANPRELVFTTRCGQAIDVPNFHSGYWRPLLKRAGLGPDVVGETLHFHALRHFAASWMIDHGLPLPEVAQIMGHATFDMTLQIYAHPITAGAQRHDAMDRMAATLVAVQDATRARQDPLTP